MQKLFCKKLVRYSEFLVTVVERKKFLTKIRDFL